MTLVYNWCHRSEILILLYNYIGILQVYYFDPIENS